MIVLASLVLVYSILKYCNNCNGKTTTKFSNIFELQVLQYTWLLD